MTDLTMLHAHWSILPFVLSLTLLALSLLICWQRKKSHKHIYLGTFAWLIPIIGTFSAMAVMLVLELTSLTESVFKLSNLAIFSAGLLIVFRTSIREAAQNLIQKFAQSNSHPKQILVRMLLGLRTTLLIICIASLSCLSLEYAQNPQIFETVQLPFVFAGIALTSLFLATLYFVAQRHGTLMPLLSFTFFGFGLGCYFLLRFKSTVVIPSDFLALETAASVANGFVYYITEEVYWSAVYMSCAFALSSWLYPLPLTFATPTANTPINKDNAYNFAEAHSSASTTEPPTNHTRFRLPQLTTFWKNTITGIALLILCIAITTIPVYRDLGVQTFYWSTWISYQSQGSLLTFISECQDLKIKKPAGYTKKDAKKLIDSYASAYNKSIGASKERKSAQAQFDKNNPTVIAIMNEAYTNLAHFDGLHSGYTGEEFITNGMTDALQSGDLLVSTYGGGTSNTEFEFLTGESCYFVGEGNAYSLYDFTDVDSLPHIFNKLGYTSTAIHAYNPNNWNRKNAYETLGFNSFISGDSFSDAETWREWPSDKATYQKILELLYDNQDPQFILDVTLANHSGYSQHLVDDSYRPGYTPDFGNEALTDELNEYLGSMKRTDEDLQWFVEQLKQLDRPVVLVFFGDHQPSFTTAYNDAWFKNEPQAAHVARLYQTQYVMWANYDVAGNTQENDQKFTAASSLASHMLNAIGAPLTDFQKAQIVIGEKLPGVGHYTTLGSDGNWYFPDDKSAPSYSLQTTLQKMSYYNFAERV
ncbi:LTA synthase family protein [Atopobium fossor]|uniref:LTA synthase family protein n=1 Tax=Atopobium fossor TaxID=39487 RepID=UPI00040E4ECA|nr:LTA synthase family protein [Atopobium fossor]